jgi:putative membrane protein
MSLMIIVMMAAFAFASPMQQDPQQSSSTTQTQSGKQTTKTDQHDHSKQNKAASDMTQNTSSSALASDDRKFIMEAAHDGMMEVKMGRMAADKASNADVKAFGQRMVDDHSRANTELMALASQKGVTLPGASDMAMTDQSSSNVSNTTAQSSNQQSSSTSSTSGQQSSTSPTTAQPSSTDTAAAAQRHARVETNTGETLKDQENTNKMMGLSGDAFDREYMNMMVKDHEKAVKDFEKVSTKAKDPDVRAFAAKTLPTLREHLQQARDIQSRVKGGKTTSSANKTSGQ